MRRADGLVTLSRRVFCGGVAACGGAAVIASCIDGSTGVVQTGPLGGPDGTNGPDGGVHHNPDGGTQPDAGTTATCPSSGVTDVGTPSSFTSGSPAYHSTGNFF